MNMTVKNRLIASAGLLAAAGAAAGLPAGGSAAQLLRTALGGCAVLLLPGYWLSYLVSKEMPAIARSCLSFGLSISAMPLALYYLNLLGMPVTSITVLLTSASFMVLSFLLSMLGETAAERSDGPER